MHLRAEMPAAPTTARGQMDVRIARKVAARGHLWFSDYRALTTTELSLGGPVVASPPPDAGRGVVDAGLFRRNRSTFRMADDTQATGYSPIPSVTLQAYGPDTKAALVLTGVNRLLRPVADAINAALADVRARIDDECLLVAVTHALLQEAFEAQQAGMVQRALRLSDGVRSRVEAGEGPVRVARIEPGWPHTDVPPRRPDQVALLWSTWDAIVTPGSDLYADRAVSKEGGYLTFGPLDGYEQDQGFTVTGTDSRDEWVAVLREVSESHLVGTTPGLSQSAVWIVRTSDGARAVAVVARERQVELVLARLAPRLVPLRRPASDAPRQVALPHFDAGSWRDSDVLTRRAALLAQYYCVRAAGWLAGMKDLDRRRDRPTCAARYGELARAAEELLDEDDPLRVQLGVQGRGYVLQYDACRGTLDHDAYRRIVADLDRLVELTRTGRYSESQLVEHLQIVLVELGTYRTATGWFSGELADQPGITADLGRLWRTARAFRDQLFDDVDGADRSYLDHDYAGFLVSDPARGPGVAEGIRLLHDEVIPARLRIAHRGGRRRGLRLSRQVLLHGLRVALDTELDTERQRRVWAADALSVADELVADRETAALVDQRPSNHPDGFDNSVLVLLLRIAEGRVAAVTSDLVINDLADRVTQTHQAVARVERYAEGPVGSAGGPVDEMRLLQVRELVRRWQTWCAARSDLSGLRA